MTHPEANTDIEVYAARIRAEVRTAQSKMISTVSAALAALTEARESVAAWRDHDYRDDHLTEDIARLLTDSSEAATEAALRLLSRFDG
ncbi:Uncharacterised protein [Mycobacteroides abscessus subsp. abscessus]|uniref:hypothetical protein n=1 Tax=Mycobacteroides abscessus TaxID=36809 RepID=UPI0009A78066|nr:hypothetical protein [Mycobacteroides abscessus]SLI01044.1 Uncharacterised protein [Mycobacteroides abscessus subsp. abscessus]